MKKEERRKPCAVCTPQLTDQLGDRNSKKGKGKWRIE